MELSEGYKNTELGQVPADWKVTTFGDTFTGFSSGMTPYRGRPEYYTGKIPWITSGELNYNIITDTWEKITEEAVLKTNLKILPVGTFLMAITGLEAAGTRGSCAITGVKATTNQSCMALFPIKNKVTTEYLYHFYVYYGDTLAFKYCQGTKQQSYTGRIAKRLPINLPPTVAEQKAIARVLSDTDVLIQTLEKKIAKKKLIQRGVMQKLLTPKEGWEEKRIDDCAYVVGGGTPSSFNSSFWNGSINWFTPTEIGISKYVYSSHRKISQEGLKNCSARILPVGTVLLTTRAGIGDLSILKVEASTNQGFQSLIAKNGQNNEFLYYLMATLQDKLLQHASGSTFLEISPGKLKSIEIKIPKKNEQNKIAQILSDMDNEIDQLEHKLAKYNLVKKGMMQQLLSGKIRLVKSNLKTTEEKLAMAAEPNESYTKK